MAFGIRSFTRATQQFNVSDTTGTALAGQLNTVWFYGTYDAAATVETAGYFNLAGPSGNSALKVGDLIIACMAMSGTPVLKHYVVLTVPAAGSNVTIGLQTVTAG